MADTEIDNELPRAVRLLFPDSHEVTVGRRLRIVHVRLGFPWTSRETHVARGGHPGKVGLPREQRFLIGRRHRMLEHPLLSVHGARTKQQAVVGNERHERLARVLVRGHLRKRLLRLHHLLERRLRLCDHRGTQNHKYYRYPHIRSSSVRSVDPIAVCNTDSGVHRSIERTSDKYPRLMTASRSHMPNNSGKYELTINTALFCAAHAAIVSYTCALLPMSMPRVGSSSKSTSASWCKRRATITFC